MALLVYVDDIVLASNHQQFICEFTIFLNTHFKLKDLGPLKFFKFFLVWRLLGLLLEFLCANASLL
jgi:hypothetical protein